MSRKNNMGNNPPAPPILAVLGSPRPGGNTDRLLDQVLLAAADRGVDAEKIVLRDLNISPCLEIEACLRTGDCPIKDDMPRLYHRLMEARALVVASPIFFYGPTAQLKGFIDRCQALWARKYILKKPPPPYERRGYVISAAATKGPKLFDGLRLTLKYFFDALSLEPAGELLVRGADSAEDLETRPEEMARAKDMGEEIAEFILKEVS